MTKIKNIQLKSILYWVARVFSVVLSLIVVIFLTNTINYGISTDYFIILLLFSLFFIVPGISIFLSAKISFWFYLILEILLVLSIIFNFSNWTIIIIPIWVLIILLLLLYEIKIAKKTN